MMKFKCPSCGNLFRVPESAAGKKGNCKKCGQIVRIPDVEKEAIPVVEETSDTDIIHGSERQSPAIVPVAVFGFIGLVILGIIISDFSRSSTEIEDSDYDYSSDINAPPSRMTSVTTSSRAESADIPKTDLNSFTRSLNEYLGECNSRIDSIESSYQESPVRITPSDEIDVKKSDSALNPYFGVLTVEVNVIDSTSTYPSHRYQFTIKPSLDGEWDFVGCYGGPPNGKYSVWSLKALAYQYQGKIAMEWLLGREKSRALLRTAL